jgi:hypothetical protein
MRLLALGAMLAASALIARSDAALAHDPAAPSGVVQVQAHDPLNCYCRAQGKTFAIGETACLRTSEGPRVAECGMVLNNTSWQFTARPCPES